MKIELKPETFKNLISLLKLEVAGIPYNHDILKELEPQYEEAFLKYKDEKQEFEVGDKVEFLGYGGDKINNGKIIQISRLANGQFRYKVEYSYICDVEDDGTEIFEKTAKYLTKKNIRKI